MVRSARRGARPGRCAAASTCCSPTSVLRRHSAAAAGWPRWPTSAAARGRRTRGRTATASSRTSTPRSRSRRARSSRCRTTRRPGRPSGATGCCRRRSRSPPTARSRRRPGPGLGVEPDLDALEQLAGRLMEIARSCCASPGERSRSRRCELDPPKAGEVLVRVAAAGVCHSDVRLADGELGDGRWPMVLGHEGAGVVEAVGAGVDARRAGRPRRVLLRPVVRRVPRVPRRAAERSAGRRGERRLARDADGRHERLLAADGTPLQHGLMTACFAERAWSRAAGAVPMPDDAAAVAGRAARLRRRHRHRRRAQRRARRASARRVA